MGVSTIISHMNRKNHQRVKNVTSPLQLLYFKPKEPDEIDKKNCSDCVRIECYKGCSCRVKETGHDL